MSRPWKVAKPELLQCLREMRAEGRSYKVMAAELGYSAGHLYVICSAFAIKKQFKLKRANTEGRHSSNLSRESVRLEQTQSAGPDSAQANTPNAGSS